MKTKKYILIILILLILLNTACIYAAGNNTGELEIDNGDNFENTLCENCEDIILQTDEINQTNHEILTQSTEEDVLSEFLTANTQVTLTVNDTGNFEDALQLNENETTLYSPPDSNYWSVEDPSFYHTQFSLNINDTTLLNTTKNITFNIHLEWDLYMAQEDYNTSKIFVYENDTVIHTFSVPDFGDSYAHNAHDIKDISFQYAIKDSTEIKAMLKREHYGFGFELESNVFSFEGIKNIAYNNLKNTSIIINNINFSNENWTNHIRYLKKAIEEASENSIIYLNDVEFLNEENMTINIDKNITIIANNAIINGLEYGTIFTVNPQATLNIINLTFTNTLANYIIKNNGNMKILNTLFKDNVGRLITNSGNLTLENCKIENITSKYRSLIKMENVPENGVIYNTEMLTLINTTFNNIDLHPTTINDKKIIWNGIIVNDAQSIIFDSQFTNINYRLIYNSRLIEINNTTIENSITTTTSHTYQIMQKLNDNLSYFEYSAKKESIEGGSIYNNDKCIISNITFQNINVYNNNQLTIKNIISNSKGLVINNNRGIIIIKNTSLTQTTITNNGNMIINTTIITGNSGISNNGIMTVSHSQIIDNDVGNSLIINTETGNIILEKTIIKNNTITCKRNPECYYGVIRNSGVMNVTGCVFDNNRPRDWNEIRFGAPGGICIYNSGKITAMYNYLLNVNYYNNPHPHFQATIPAYFLYNVLQSTCNINYNFFCLSPSSVVQNANVNYYFIPAFEDDYYPIKLNENKNIRLTLGLTNGVDKINFNDWDKLLTPGLNATITTINENGEYINITTFLKDYFTFNFNYTNNKTIYTIFANILNYNNTAIVDIGKEFPEMTVTYNNNITYNDGNKFTFHIKVNGNLTNQPTGNLTLTYNNKKVILNLTDGECNYTINETLKPDNYTMRIDYNGDEEYFRIIKQFYPFTVHKIPTNITLVAPEIKIGETGKLTITITPSNAKLYGYLYYTTDRLHEANADTRGTRTLSLKNFPVGVHNLTVIFDEDEYYLGGTVSTLFTVSKYETQLNITASDVAPGKDNTTINITINPGDVRGDAIIKLNNETQNIYINNTITPITLTNLKEGTYTVTVYYPGDSKYAPSNATTTFSVARITSKLNVQLTQNNNLTGNIRIQSNPINCTGEVAIYINNDRTILNLTDGTINTQIKFKRGTNYIYIHYNGDNTYSISSWNTTINIEGIPVLTLETQKLETGKTGYVRVNLTDTNNIPYEYTNITIEFQNTTNTITTNKNGTAYLPINTQTGTYTIKATYQNATITKNITVKTLTQLKVNIQDINQADDLLVYATLTDSNSNKLNGEIILEINGNYYKIIITNGAGSRNLGEFKAGTYTYTATYPENNILYSTNTTGSFKVNRDIYKITGNTDITQYYGSTKYYKIRLTNNNQPVKNEIITVTINKNTVKIKTDNNGYATLKLSLKAGKYTITATYKNVKVSNKITVKPTLITKNKKIKKGKTLTYTAKLLNKNGKALKNKKITFKINGKKYKAKTNKKGIAKIKVKNLKAGKYKIQTTYGKQKNTNWVTVKK